MAGQTTDRPALRIVPAAEAPFADVETVFGTRGDPATCWCQWYKIPGPDWRSVGVDDLRARLEAQLTAPGAGPGLLAYSGEEPVGWCAVEPRANLPRLRRSRTVKSGTAHGDLDDPGVWAVSCFVVPRAHRGLGVGSELARAAIAFAHSNGAAVLEAYAVDPTAKAKPSAAELFPGTVSMFAAAGFAEVARPSPTRVVMQVEFAGAAR
ncbi:GNAT family N-acetyltransferase [Agromyces agglutinans]|nr:GNAT family N-acetyltransferase [Agromyces agglutinans]